jgi:hypothetical protein
VQVLGLSFHDAMRYITVTDRRSRLSEGCDPQFFRRDEAEPARGRERPVGADLGRNRGGRLALTRSRRRTRASAAAPWAGALPWDRAQRRL